VITEKILKSIAKLIGMTRPGKKEIEAISSATIHANGHHDENNGMG